MKTFVTGATGMVGSCLVERLVREGHRVKALVRKTSDTRALEELGVELCYGEITSSSETLRPLLKGVEWVFHIAALVSDWASREEMVKANVTSLESLARAADPGTLKRFIFIGSMAVLGMDRQDNLDESSPWIHSGDNYNYTKILAEQLAVRLAREEHYPITILRPPYLYGPRDRQFLPRVVQAIEKKIFTYIGDGSQPFTLLYVENLVDALLLAAKQEKRPSGEIYMITDGESITRRRLVEILCEEMGLDRPKKRVPVWLAYALCPLLEGINKAFRIRRPPLINRFRIKFMHTYLTFNISKARRELGYQPRLGTEEALRKSIRWFRDHRHEYKDLLAQI
jgi:nucleoside-diphosphate-sugar epimerase